MLWLPTGIRNWYEKKAIEKNQNLGSYLIQVLSDLAVKDGFVCNHPSAYQVLFKKIDGKNFDRCKNCGHVYLHETKKPW